MVSKVYNLCYDLDQNSIVAYLTYIYWAPTMCHILLGARNMEINKTDKVPAVVELTF